MCNQCCCCYSKPILDVADNKFAESAAVLMLKGLSYERGWLESVANLAASHFERYLSNDTAFSQINLDGSPFKGPSHQIRFAQKWYG
jgi:hypothetical protein